MKIKKISALAITAALVLVVGATAAFASSAQPAEDKENDPSTGQNDPNIQQDTASGILTMQTDPETGETRYSLDGGSWLSEEEYQAQYPEPDVVWWTAEEYEAWLEQERLELPKLIGEKGWNGGEGEFVWTQERVDNAIAMYEETLEEIKRGVKHSKTVDGRDDIALAQDLSDMEIDQSYAAVISNGDEETTLESDDPDQLAQDVEQYVGEQVANGGMTEAEAAKVLEDMEKTQ